MARILRKLKLINLAHYYKVGNTHTHTPHEIEQGAGPKKKIQHRLSLTKLSLPFQCVGAGL